ncbi:unnamed protein product [Closterium sp. NIES-53]
MTLRPSTAPHRVPLPSPPASSLPVCPDPESDSLRAASPTVARFLATVVTDPLFESSAASALVAELADFAAACRLDYATSLVDASASVSICPPFVRGECALGTDVLEDRQEEFECFVASVPHLGPYSSQWQAAMDAKMASCKSTGTYVDEVPPPGANIVSGMWIFRVKRPPGSPPAFKARYVARGFSQRHGVDFFQTFSPTPKMTTRRVLLHVAPQRDYELHSLDFSTAFLQGSLHEEIWLRRPPGFIGSFPPSTKWSFWRPVYGLRQAPREWHDTLRTTLASLGFSPSIADPSLFLRTVATLPPFYVLVYVDDLVFATADTEALAHMKSELQKKHMCTDLGELTSYLGLQITRDRAKRTITLTQSHMVQQVLQRFGFTYSSPQSTLLPTGHSLSAPLSDESVEPSGPYPELVGCLMYLMTCTRPDLAYPLSLLARYVAPAMAPRSANYLNMGLVLGGRARVVLTGHADASWVDDLATQWSSQGSTFILGSGSVSWRTSGTGLVLGGWGSVVVTGHSDASWADDHATQRSSMRYTFSLGFGSVSWRSTRCSSVLGSSCEAEIYAGAMAAQELRWLTYLLTDLGERPRSPLVLYVDNKAMLALCREQRLEHRMKHISLRYFLVHELQQRRQLRLSYVASHANTADVFTMALRLCGVLEIHPELCFACSLACLRPLRLRRVIPAVPSRPVAPAVPSPLLSRPVAPAVPSRCPYRLIALAIPSRPVAPAVPSPLLSRPVAPAVASSLLSPAVASPLLSHRDATAVPSRPVVPAVPSRRPRSVPPHRAVCPVPSRRAHPVRPARPSRPVRPARPSRPVRSARPSRPVRLARPSHPRCALPVRRAPCALLVAPVPANCVRPVVSHCLSCPTQAL